MTDFEAARRFITRCLRFTTGVTARHARLASGWRAAPLPGGSRTRWIATRGFSSCHPPLQGFPWRNNRSVKPWNRPAHAGDHGARPRGFRPAQSFSAAVGPNWHGFAERLPSGEAARTDEAWWKYLTADGAAIVRTGLPQRTSTAAHVAQRTAATCGGQCGVCGAARPAGPRFRKPRGCVGGISCAPSGACPFRTAERRTTDTAFGAAGSASGVSASPPPRSQLTWDRIWYTNDRLGQAGMRIPGRVRVPWAGIAFDGWTRP